MNWTSPASPILVNTWFDYPPAADDRVIEEYRDLEGAAHQIDQVHHWNFSKGRYPAQVLDARNLGEIRDGLRVNS